MIEKLKPVFIPAIIAAVISCLIIVVYNFTYVDTTAILTDKQAKAVCEIYGGTKDDYEVVLLEDYPEALVTADKDGKKVCAVPELSKLIRRKSDGAVAFDMIVKGYKKGFDIMVGVEDGAIAGVAIVSYNEETPGLGANNKTEGKLLEALKGRAEPSEVKKDIDAMTSATYSSKGIVSAANIALDIYNKCESDFARGGEPS